MQNIIFANTKTHKKQDKTMLIVLFIITCLVSAFFVYTAINLPMHSADEAFYLTIPHRLILGDSLIVDEWHPTQFSSFALYPFVWFYVKCFGSTNGIILFMRLVYFLLQLATGLVIYFKLRHKSYFCAITAMLAFSLYIPICIPQFSYNAQGMIFTELIALLLFSTTKIGFIQCYLAGIFTALAVTAQPFGAIVYFVYSLIILLYRIYRPKKPSLKNSCIYLKPRVWLYLTLGILSVFTVFILYMLKNATFSQLLNSIPNIFNDNEYNLSSLDLSLFISRYSEVFIELYNDNELFFLTYVLTPPFLILGLKKSENKDNFISICTVVCNILYWVYTIVLLFSAYRNNITFLLRRPFPLFVLGINACILTKNKNKKLILWWMLGIIYILFCGSDILQFTGNVGYVISNTASIMMLYDLFYEESKKTLSVNAVQNEHQTITDLLNNVHLRKHLISATLSVSLIFVIICEVFTGLYITLNRDSIMTMQYTDYKVEQQYRKVENGPLAGISMPENQIDEYNNILCDLDYINNACSGKIIIPEIIPWCYLYLNKPYTTFSAWCSSSGVVFYKYSEYFLKNSNYPECIYIPYDDLSIYNFTDCQESVEYFSEKFDCRIENGMCGYILFVNK